MKQLRSLYILLGGLFLLVAASSVSGVTSDVPSAKHHLYLPVVQASNTVVISNVAHPLSEDTTSHLDSISDDGSILTFDQTTTELLDLSPGDVVVSGVSNAAPNGFLREVTALSHTNGKTTIITKSAILEDVIVQGGFSLSQDLRPEPNTEMVVAENIFASSFEHANGETGWYFDLLDVPLGCIRASGTISISDIHLDVGGEFENSDLKHFRAVLTSDISDDLTFETVCQQSYVDVETVIAGPIPLTQPIVGSIGPIPIVITPLIDISVGAKGEVKIGASVRGHLEFHSRAGAVYNNDGLDLIGDFGFDASADAVQTKAGLNAKVYGGPEVSILLYGVAGAYLKFGPFLELESDIFTPELWKLYYGAEVPIGLELSAVGHDIADYEGLAIRYKQLWKEGSTDPLITPATPTPTTSATSTPTPSLTASATPTPTTSATPTPTTSATPTPTSTPEIGGSTSLVSRHSDGTKGNNQSYYSSISANGRFVAYESRANNLVDDDTNYKYDIFVHDRQTGETTLVSRHTDGTQGNAKSDSPFISGDGRFVVFESEATNLIDGDNNAVADIFVHDRQTGETTLVSRHTDGTQGNDSPWGYHSISGDGRIVVFLSGATNLIDNDKNGFRDVFVHDRQTGETALVSRHTDGTQANWDSSNPSISGDGRFVLFASGATNLIDGDNNAVADIFVHNRQTGETTLVSRHTDGTQGNKSSWGYSISAISHQGRYAVFTSEASNLVDNDKNGFRDVFVHNRQTGETTLVSHHTNRTQGNDDSGGCAISNNGRFVVFDSFANNLINGDNNYQDDIFFHDRQTGETTLVSRHTDGTQGEGGSWSPFVSAEGRFVSFTSSAQNIVDDDTGQADIFVRDRGK